MAGVFISYRRNDNKEGARLVYDGIRGTFEKKYWLGLGPKRAKVFFDVHSIAAGKDFLEKIRNMVVSSDVLLVVIGDKWLEKNKSGRYRIKEPKDVVRLEIETAFSENKTVIPVLINGASMPAAKSLPKSIEQLTRLNAVTIDSGVNKDNDIARLTEAISATIHWRWFEAAGAAAAIVAAAGLGYAIYQSLPISDPTYKLVVESLHMKDCRGATDNRMDGRVFNYQDQPCIELNGKPIWGCKNVSVRCHTGVPTVLDDVVVELAREKNVLRVLEENKEGNESKFRTIGTVDPEVLLEPGEFEQTFTNENNPDRPFEYVIKGRVEVAE